jgi:serine/threonine protein kinase
MVEKVGRYRVTRIIGEGGMGIVYAAHDDRLDRPVAIKVIRPEAIADGTARERFRREARAAARVSHPHICTLYEFDEIDGQPFLVMELLEGEPLAARIARGPLTPADTLDVALPMLEALAALHESGIIHRDLKPANVFLTPHGVKLLDFGLAEPPSAVQDTGTVRLTTRGLVVGTPQYMAPEQLDGEAADQRTDIFAAGVVIYEMLAGRPPFTGRSVQQLMRAVLTEEPVELAGSPEIEAIYSVLRAALEREPNKRLQRAEELADGLRQAVASPGGMGFTRRPKVTRFVALPLRILRPDPDTDFLAFSVPDAVSAALSEVESMIVRSPQAVPAGTDVRELAVSLGVDVVFTGSILRAGNAVRVTGQLTDAAAGTLIWSDTIQAPTTDLFQLQDTLTERIVSSLSLPISATDRRALGHQAPSSAEAYELYLRANQLMTRSAEWDVARGLYERAVELDPTYAPAWARLGRARRVIAKWGGPKGIGLMSQAEAAFRRALQIDPDLSIAHDLSAYAEAELGRAPQAMARLLRRVVSRPSDLGVLAGLVTTCRYSGLYEASLAAHVRARSIDPDCVTSVCWTHLMRGDFDNAIATDVGTPPFCALLSHTIRGDLKLEEVQRLEESTADGTKLGMRAYRHVLEGNVGGAVAALEELRDFGFADPEGWYTFALLLARLGAREAALSWLADAIGAGYACHGPLLNLPEWKALSNDRRWPSLVAGAEAKLAYARTLFESAGGHVALGLDDLRFASTTSTRTVGRR